MRPVAFVGILACVTSAACGRDKCQGTSCFSVLDGAIDTPGPVDAPVDATWLTVSGTVKDAISGTLLTGATITVYRRSNHAVIATTTTTDGTYSLPLPANGPSQNGERIDGYVGAALSGYADSYLFFAPDGRVNGDIRLLTPDAMTMLYSTVGITQDTTAGLIQGTIAAVARNGACTLSATGTGTIKYGMPPSTTATSAFDGVGWVFNASVGAKSVTAVAPRNLFVRFDAREVDVFANAFSTTVLEGIPSEVAPEAPGE